MFFVLCHRVVKVNTGATEKFSPRTSNNVYEYLSGPFSERLAEKAALAAIATHTCLGARVITVDDFIEMFEKCDRQPWGYRFAEQYRPLYKKLTELRAAAQVALQEPTNA